MHFRCINSDGTELSKASLPDWNQWNRLLSGEWMDWSVVEQSRVRHGVKQSGVETNKCHVKYEANVSELACDERSKINC